MAPGRYQTFQALFAHGIEKKAGEPQIVLYDQQDTISRRMSSRSSPTSFTEDVSESGFRSA